MQRIFSLRVLAVLTMAGAVASCDWAGFNPPVPSGAEDFVAFCAACHGLTGVGDGEVASTLPKKPANLTRISARNGGAFPMAKVMTKIWGYARKDGVVMPSFAPLLDGAIVPFDSGDGIATPTPLRLVQLAGYLREIQK